MAGYIAEFFGYRPQDSSSVAIKAAQDKKCPFIGAPCSKILGHTGEISGVCAIRQKSPGVPPVICCPNRFYANSYKLLHDIAFRVFEKNKELVAGRTAVEKAKKNKGAIAVFGHGWGGELRLPQRQGTGSYFVDWVLADLDSNGQLTEFTAIEIQTIDTTGKYTEARSKLLNGRQIESDTVGLNWENVSKRIIPQLIYKGQVLQREELCKSGLFFVCPAPVFERIITRLGGRKGIPEFPSQPASIHFIAYDYACSFDKCPNGVLMELGIREELCSTVYKVQEAFSAVNLPEGNVYGNAIRKALYQ